MRPCFFAISIVLLALFADARAAPMDWTHEQAITAARAGRTGEALERLRELHAASPSEALRRDLLVVAHWHGDDHQALEWARQIDPAAPLPRYVLSAAARVYRASGELEDAQAAYRECSQRWPDDRDCRIGLGLVLGESGEVDAGVAMLESMLAEETKAERVYPELGYLYRLKRDWLAAAQAYQRAAELAANPLPHRRDQILSLLDLGASHQAQVLSQAYPDAMNDGLRTRLRADLAAKHINWVDLPTRSLEVRRQRIARAERSLARVDDSPETRRRAFFDRLLLLDRYNRPERLIERFEAAPEWAEPMPDYVLAVVASAYLSAGEPERSLEQIERMSEDGRRRFDLQAVTVYALEEDERFSDALALADRMVDEQPAWRRYPGLRQPQPNPQRVRADRLAAMIRAYRSRHAEAESRLRRLLDEAPLEANVRAELAAVLGWRGMPRAAEQEYRILLSYQPEHVDAQIGLANQLAIQGHRHEAERYWQALSEQVPGWWHGELEPGASDQSEPTTSEAIRLSRARRDYLRSHGWAFDGKAATTDSDGINVVGERAWLLSAALTSPLSEDGYRWLAGTDWWRADFPEGRGQSRVDRIEVHRRRRDWHGHVGWHQDRLDARADGPHAELAYHPDDFDTWRLRLAINDWNAPLRGRVRGVTADSATFSYDRRWSEFQSFGASVTAMNFDDGNRRRSGLLAFNQRLFTDNHFQLDGRVDAYASRNDEVDAFYFNPTRDAALGLGLTINQRLYRDYFHQLRQRIELSAGPYWQEGFGTHLIGTVAWRPRWDIGPNVAVELGLSWQSRVYDGERENQYNIELLTNWRWR